MPTTSLRSLAGHLGVPERTLRRAAAQGLVHGTRTSARRFETSLREEAYLREHWPLLSKLRAALRTEPNVRLAVLIGSLATGSGHPRSDADLLVSLSEPGAGRLADLTVRLERQLARPVDAFTSAYDSDDPTLLNQVNAVERGVDRLYNTIAELTALGLQLAAVRPVGGDLNARRDIRDLHRIGVIGRERARRLERLRELRRPLVHEYATATAGQIHEAARIVADEFAPFYEDYRRWIGLGFAVDGSQAGA